MAPDDFGTAFPGSGAPRPPDDDEPIIRITPEDIAGTSPGHQPSVLLPSGYSNQTPHRPATPEEVARYRYGVIIGPPKRREQVFVGVLRNLRRSQERDDYVVIFSNQQRQRTIEVRSFEVEIADDDGNPIEHVPVEVRGHEISGDTLNDATPVAVYGARSRDGTVYTGRVLNLRTASALRVLVAPREKCFVATAVYGSGDAQKVEILQHFRDRVLHPHIFGRVLIVSYYVCGPWVAAHISDHPQLTNIVKRLLNLVVKGAAWVNGHFTAGSSQAPV